MKRGKSCEKCKLNLSSAHTNSVVSIPKPTENISGIKYVN